MSRKASNIFYAVIIFITVIIIIISAIGLYQNLKLYRNNFTFIVRDSGYQTQLDQEIDKAFVNLESLRLTAEITNTINSPFDSYQFIGQKMLSTGKKLIKAREFVNNENFDDAERYLNSAKKDLKELSSTQHNEK